MKYLFFLGGILIFSLLPSVLILAAETQSIAGYKPIVGIPGITSENSDNFSSYINAIYTLAISLAALAAVIKIIIAGVKIMTTDVVTARGEAKKDIQSALIGLVIIISAVLVIEIINPNINDVELSIAKLDNRIFTEEINDYLETPYDEENDRLLAAVSQEECENVDQTTCKETRKKYRQNNPACYRGEFISEKNTCVIRAANNVYENQRFPYEDIEEEHWRGKFFFIK